MFIDVREAHGLVLGIISNALHITLSTLLFDKDSINDIALNAHVIVYCQHGVRSFFAASHLTVLGFRNVANITGGIEYWYGVLQK